MPDSNRSVKLTYIGVITAIVLGLYLGSLYSYLLFHSLVEITTIAIGFTLFILTWNARRLLANNFLNILGIGYSFIALIDLLHTLAYKGMNVFPGFGANLPTQLWIAARYLQAVTLCAAPLFVERRVDNRAIFGGYAAAVSVLVAMVYSGNFPDCYIEEKGLTTFKISSEYVITALLLTSSYLLYRKRRYFNDRVFFLTVSSIACTTISEISFTAYLSVYGFANMVGHFSKLAAFYLIYRAILVTGLKEPFDLIFRELRQAQEAISKAHDTLEEQVRERTAELRASEEKYRALIECANDAVFIHEIREDGMPGPFIEVNELACRQLGYSREELARLGPMELDDPRYRDRIQEAMERLFKDGHAVFETAQIAKDGRSIPVEVSTRVIEIRGKRLLFSLVRDITERKRAEEVLLQERALLRCIIDSASDLIFIKNRHSVYLGCNKASERFIGLPESEQIGKTDFDFFDQEKARLIRDNDRQVVEDGKTLQAEEWVIYPDARRVLLDTLKVPFYGPDGEIHGLVGICRDISERKRAENINLGRLRLLQFAAAHSLDELLQATLDEVETLTGSVIGFYHFLEPDQKTLSLQSWSKRTKAEFCPAEGKGLKYDVSQAGVWADCVRVRRPVVHNDYASLPHRKGIPHGHAPVIRELVVPVVRGDKIMAILGVGNKPENYTEQDLETVSIFADLAWEIAERKRAEVRLALVDFALNNVHEAAYLIDEYGCFHYVNYESCRSLGYHCDELLALTVADVDPDWPLLRWPDHWRDLKELGSLNFEGRHRKKDGHIFPVEINANYFEYDGRSYNLALVRDITERKRAEVLLRKREEEFRTLAENLPDNIIRYDRQCRKTYVNSNLLRLYGVDLRLVLGKTPEELHPEGLTRKDEFYDKLRRVMETGEPDEIEVSVSYPSGEFQTHNVRFVAERDKQGNVVGAIGIGRDITERKRAVQLLQESEERYRTLFEESTDGVFITSVEGTILDINKTGIRIFGYDSKEEMLRLDPARDVYVDSEDRKRMVSTLSESGLSEYEILVKKKNGEKMLARCATNAVRGADGTIIAYQGVIRDIAEQKRLEQELFKAKKLEIIGELAGGVAHEVRNPLNAILSISEALFREKEIADNPEYLPYVQHIRTQVGRLSKLMTDLLDLGKPIKPASIFPVSLDKACTETINLWNMTESAQVHPVVFTCDHNVGDLQVSADGARLQQVLLNLIENAAQHSPAGSRIILHIVEAAGQRVTIQVGDAGKGISPEKIERVFEPFFTTRTGGTGLGLSLVKHFVESMGGEVMIRNNDPPPGCTVELVLSIAKEDGGGDRETENTVN